MSSVTKVIVTGAMKTLVVIILRPHGAGKIVSIVFSFEGQIVAAY
jgi:hypothetical protein